MGKDLTLVPSSNHFLALGEPMFRRAAAEPEQEEGFSLSIELSEEIRAINLRDNDLHPRVIE